jgi:hypothetical protein
MTGSVPHEGVLEDFVLLICHQNLIYFFRVLDGWITLCSSSQSPVTRAANGNIQMDLILHLPLGAFFPTLFYSHSGLNEMPSFNNFMMFCFFGGGAGFCTNVKNKYEKRIFNHLFLW